MEDTPTLIIRNGTIIDGSGGQAYKADIEVRLVGTNIITKIINFFVRILEFLAGIRRKGTLVEYADKIKVTIDEK